MLRNVTNDSSEIGVREDRVACFTFTLSNPMRISNVSVEWGNEKKIFFFYFNAIYFHVIIFCFNVILLLFFKLRSNGTIYCERECSVFFSLS